MHCPTYKTLLTALALSVGTPLAKAADLPANARNHDPVIHVAPDGDDANQGTAAAPLRTLVGARDAVRKVNRTAPGDVVVHLHGGEYLIRILDNHTSKIVVRDNVQSNPAVEANAGIKPGYHPRRTDQ